MRAWVVRNRARSTTGRSRLVDRAAPTRPGRDPGPGVVRGVPHRPAPRGGRPRARARRTWCPATRSWVVVDALGAGGHRFDIGERVGIAWLRHTAAACRFCRRGDENLCVDPALHRLGRRRRLRRVRGGRRARYAYACRTVSDDEQAAPLLCAGIIGYRALRRASCRPGGRLGIYGFGASAHLAAQVACAQARRVHVMTRSADARRLALSSAWTRPGTRPTRRPSRSTPRSCSRRWARSSRPRSLRSTAAASLAVAGIHLSDIPPLHYQRHLFEERRLRSVTANTRRDGEEFLALAARIGPGHHRAVPARRRTPALRDLAHGQVRGGRSHVG